MKSRHWILFAVLAAVLAVVALPAAKRFLRVDREFRRILVRQLSAAAGRPVSVDEARLMPGTVTVLGMRAGGVSVERIDLRYNLLRLVTGGFDVVRAVTRVVVDHPVVRLDSLPAFPRGGGNVPDLPDCRVVLSRGELHLAGPAGYVPVCHMLDVVGTLVDGRAAGVHCEAHLMNGSNVMRRNFTLTGDYDVRGGAWRATAALTGAAPPRDVYWERFLPGVERPGGTLDVELSGRRDGPGLPVHCTGTVSYGGDTLALAGLPAPVTGLRARFVLDGAGALGRLSGRYRSAAVSGEGRIDWPVAGVTVDGDVSVTGIGSRIVYDFIPSLRGYAGVSGGRVRIRASGPARRPRADGTVSADTVDIRGYRIGGLRGGITYGDGRLGVNGVAGRNRHARVAVGGTVDVRDGGRTAFDLTFTEDSLAALSGAFMASAPGGRGTVTLAVRGRPDSLSYSGRFDLDRIAVADHLRLDRVEGSYGFRGNDLHFAARMKDRSYHLEGMLTSVRDTLGMFARLRVNRVSVDSLAAQFGLDRQGVPGHLNALFEIRGRGARFDLAGHGNLIGNPVLDGGFTMRGGLETGADGPVLDASVALSGMRLNGAGIDASFRVRTDRAVVELTDADIAGLLTGGASLSLEGAQALDGRFELSRSRIGELSRYVPARLLPAALDGSVEGTVTLAGSAAAPAAKADLTLTGGRLYRQERLNGIAALTFADGALTFDNVKLFTGKDELLAVTGGVRPGGGTIVFSGRNVDAAVLLACTPLVTMPLAGRVDYRVTAAGGGAARSVAAEVEGRDGRLGTVAFSRMNMRAGWDGAAFTLNELRLDRDDDYTVSAFGSFSQDLVGLAPADDGGAGTTDLRINADGNLMHLIPHYERFMDRAQCTGKMAVRLARDGRRLVLDDLNMRFSNGEILFRSYPLPVEDLNGQLRFDREQRFIAVDRLYGSVEGNRFSVANAPSVDTPDGTVGPFTLDFIGATLGVFMFDLGRGTKEIYVPGLMRSDERTSALVRGRTAREKFMLGGPNGRPRLRGELEVADVDITYPFIRDEGSGNDGYRGGDGPSVLERVDWDLRVLAARNVRYYVEMDLVDRFDADMEVEEDGELDIRGRLADSSFYLQGVLESADGRIHYMGESFDVNTVEVAFDRYHAVPAVTGEAQSVAETGFGDSTATERIIYLRPYMEDEDTGDKIYRARWDRMKLEMSSNFDTDDPFAEFAIFDTVSISEKARDAIGIGVQSYLIRPYMRPLERRLEKWSENLSNWLKMRDLFKLDMVRLDPVIGDLFASESEGFLRRSNFTLGKSFYGNMFLTYTGYFDMMSDADAETGTGLGLNEHRLGLQFRLMRNLRLEYEYDYRIDSVDPHRQGIQLKYFWYLDRERKK